MIITMDKKMQAVIYMLMCVYLVSGNDIRALVTECALDGATMVMFLQNGNNSEKLFICVFGGAITCFNSDAEIIDYSKSPDQRNIYITNGSVRLSINFLNHTRSTLNGATDPCCRVIHLEHTEGGQDGEYMVADPAAKGAVACKIVNKDAWRSVSCNDLFGRCPGCTMDVIVTEYADDTRGLSHINYVCRSSASCYPNIDKLVSSTVFLWAVTSQESCPNTVTSSAISSYLTTTKATTFKSTSELTPKATTTSKSTPESTHHSATELFTFTTKHTIENSTIAFALKSKIKGASLLHILLPVVLLGLLLIALIIFIICWRRNRKRMVSKRPHNTQQITQQNAYEEIDSAHGKSFRDPGVHYEDIPEKTKSQLNKNTRNSEIEMFDNTYYVSSGKTDIENVYDEAAGLKYDTPEKVINQNLNKESLPVQDSKDRSGNTPICRNTNNSKETNIATSTASAEDVNDGSDIEMFDNDVYDRTVS